jgi:hypothetical protein
MLENERRQTVHLKGELLITFSQLMIENPAARHRHLMSPKSV